MFLPDVIFPVKPDLLLLDAQKRIVVDFSGIEHKVPVVTVGGVKEGKYRALAHPSFIFPGIDVHHQHVELRVHPDRARVAVVAELRGRGISPPVEQIDAAGSFSADELPQPFR